MKNAPATIEAVIFDMDGTLIDSEPLAARTTLSIYEKWGISLPREEAQVVTGKTWESAFEYLFKKYPPPLAHAQAAKTILDEYHRLSSQDLVCVEGAVEFVRDIAAHRPEIKLALVSGSHRATILFVLEKLDILSHFSVVLGAEDYPRSKPAPDGFLKALKLLSVSAENAMVFEDSTPGITSAKSAGIYTVAITCTNHFQQDTSLANIEIPHYGPWNWLKFLAHVQKK